MSNSLTLAVSKVSRRGIIAGCALAGALIFAGWRWADNRGWLANGTSVAPSTVTSAASVAQTPPKAGGTSTTTPSDPANTPKIESPVAAPLVYAGNLGVITDLKAELQELKLQVELEEQKQRLLQLRQPATMATPSLSPDLLASLTPPASTAPAFPRSGGEKGTAEKSTVRLISIQASGTVRSATLSTPAGTMIVRQGDAFQGSTIRHITDDVVTLASGRRITWE